MNFENLMLESTGNNVKILQEKLKILGFYNGLITGSFGLATEEGVKAFQKTYNLDETGIVDNETWNLLFYYTSPSISLISNYPNLSLGSSGEYVRDLQTKLKALLYYREQINSNYDLETENAVKRFQLLNDITTTGITNDETWNLINNLYGNLNECAIEDENNSFETYTVQSGDKIFMGNNEVYKESLKEVLFKCKIFFYLSAKIALKMFTYYYRNDIIVV